MEIHLSVWEGLEPDRLEVEVVERKGLGHPDSIADGIAESFSRALSKYYLDKFNRILHHNVDKAILVGGVNKPRFKGGRIIKPMNFILVGRATDKFEGEKIPLKEIYLESAKDYLRFIRHLDVEKHIRLRMMVRPGSPDLVSLFSEKYEIPRSNDTSYGVGFAPFTPVERLVLETEKYLSEILRFECPWIGEDIKVMAVRRNSHVHLTIACAFVSRYIDSVDDYYDKKNLVKKKLVEYLNRKSNLNVTVDINTADNGESVYITVTGTSAEGGDDGQVGRGNRVSGLITPLRLMTLEAAAGKNPISHVGKLYNISAQRIAEELVEKIKEIKSAYVLMVSSIGQPITSPQFLKVWVKLHDKSVKLSSLEEEIKKIVSKGIEELPNMWKDLIDGKRKIF